MTYRALGLMSGSSLDGLDIVFVELTVNAGQWHYEILAADCYSYSDQWKQKLTEATSLNALDYQLLHAEYGHYLGSEINRFIDSNDLHFKVGLIASHGHTTFHVPSKRMTAQLGDGAAIAAETGLPVITDLRSVDVAFGGQGAPIVPIGEKLLFPDFNLFLNLGGIANISYNNSDKYIAFDVCPANRVLNLIAAEKNKEYDENGAMASKGSVHKPLLQKLNELDYYNKPYPKSLANDFGTNVIYPLIRSFNLSPEDALSTYCEHIIDQISSSLSRLNTGPSNLFITGGGAFNLYLVEHLRTELKKFHIDVSIPEESIIKYKEAIIIALIGTLRWRLEYTVMASVTGAQRNSIGGALWTGEEA